jgi:hypothetical protein
LVEGGGGIDRTIVFERHCPQYSDKTGRKKLPCYLTKAAATKRGRKEEMDEMKTEGNRRLMENLPSA